MALYNMKKTITAVLTSILLCTLMSISANAQVNQKVSIRIRSLLGPTRTSPAYDAWADQAIYSTLDGTIDSKIKTSGTIKDIVGIQNRIVGTKNWSDDGAVPTFVIDFESVDDYEFSLSQVNFAVQCLNKDYAGMLDNSLTYNTGDYSYTTYAVGYTADSAFVRSGPSSQKVRRLIMLVWPKNFRVTTEQSAAVIQNTVNANPFGMHIWASIVDTVEVGVSHTMVYTHAKMVPSTLVSPRIVLQDGTKGKMQFYVTGGASSEESFIIESSSDLIHWKAFRVTGYKIPNAIPFDFYKNRFFRAILQ